MKIEGMGNIDTVFNAIENYVQDIENIQQKEYLAPALTSHIARGHDLPTEFVAKAVALFFLSGSV